MTYKGNQSFKINKEDKLLLFCARTRIDPEFKEEILVLIQGDLDWRYLIWRASQHKLTQLLYWNLKNFPKNVPENVLGDLKKSFEGNARRNLLLLGELLKVLKLFESEGVNAIPYKGPILADYAYGNISLRQFDDLDIFVSRNDVLKAKEILVTHGYKPQFELDGFMQKKFLKSQREYKFYNSVTGVNVEIHWQFQGVSFSFSGNSRFLEDFERVKINNKEISNLKPENMLIVMCVHASGHLWERLSWICDISELIQSHGMDWDYITQKCDELGIKRVLRVNLLLAVDLFDLNLPDDVLDDITSNDVVRDLVFKVKERIFSSDLQSIFQMADIRLNIREKRFNQVKDLFNVLFTPTNKEWDESSLKLLFPPVSYVLRFINVLKDY